jgi:hypothetical protein
MAISDYFLQKCYNNFVIFDRVSASYCAMVSRRYH